MRPWNVEYEIIVRHTDIYVTECYIGLGIWKSVTGIDEATGQRYDNDYVVEYCSQFCLENFVLT